MQAILRLFWNICLLRVGPEAVPAASSLLLLTIFSYLLLDIGWTALVVNASLFLCFFSVVTIWLVSQLLIVLLLNFKNLRNRITATLIAWNGSDLILSVFMIAVQSVMLLLKNGNPIAPILELVFMLMLVWDALVKGFIFHRALNVNQIQGTFLAVAVNVFLFWLDRQLISN